MAYSVESIKDDIEGVAGAHITPHGATYTTVFNREGVLVTVSFEKWSFSHYTRLTSVPEAVQGDLIHCAVHYVSLVLLQHIYKA